MPHPPIRLAIVLLAALPTLAAAQEPRPATTPGVCTAETPPARDQVRAALADPEIADVLERAGLGAVEPADVRVLYNPRDTDACARLQTVVPRAYPVHGPLAPWNATYFRAGDRYIVTVTLDPDAELDQPMPAWGQTLIVDEGFQLLETILN
jgi:hypothetical protein